MAGPRTERYLVQLEDLVRTCDLQQLLATIGSDDVPEITAADKGGALTGDDLLDRASMILIAIIHDLAAERGQHLRIVRDV